MTALKCKRESGTFLLNLSVASEKCLPLKPLSPVDQAPRDLSPIPGLIPVPPLPGSSHTGLVLIPPGCQVPFSSRPLPGPGCKLLATFLVSSPALPTPGWRPPGVPSRKALLQAKPLLVLSQHPGQPWTVPCSALSPTSRPSVNGACWESEGGLEAGCSAHHQAQR